MSHCELILVLSSGQFPWHGACISSSNSISFLVDLSRFQILFPWFGTAGSCCVVVMALFIQYLHRQPRNSVKAQDGGRITRGLHSLLFGL
jgi:hypothetical protein